MLDILERLVNNPELIMTELFTEGVTDCQFLYQVNVNGKYILDYLNEYLKTLPVFNDTDIQIAHCLLYISVPALRCERYPRLQIKDRILIVDIYERTYEFYKYDIKTYTDEMNNDYELKTYELSKFWKKYENFTLKNRIKNAFLSLTTNKSLHVRLSDFVFILFVSRKKIDDAVNNERKEVEKNNKWRREDYERNVALQNFYKKYAPDHIAMIRSKQKEITDYLSSIGYSEKSEIE